MQSLRKNNQGFTIIEVLIVLAIAALIMLIVFLAVPALQRNSRNNARNNDASRISSAVTECMSNRNGQVDSCDAWPAEVDPGSLSQLTTVTIATSGNAGGGTETAAVTYGLRCDAAGEDTDTGSDRDHVVRFQIETSGGTLQRCID